jgi:PBP1b-binding outer membrane lipoprotein LpoB
MKSAAILLMLAAMVLAGCSGDTGPVNEGKDKPVPAKKDK